MRLASAGLRAFGVGKCLYEPSGPSLFRAVESDIAEQAGEVVIRSGRNNDLSNCNLIAVIAHEPYLPSVAGGRTSEENAVGAMRVHAGAVTYGPDLRMAPSAHTESRG